MNLKIFRITMLTVIVTLLSHPVFSAENEIQAEPAIGFAVDLLPTVLSAVDGKAGFSVQSWAGYDHFRIRLVAAHLYQPDSMIDSSFQNYELNVTAFIIDWFPQGNLSGFWFGTGSELWNSRIRHKSAGSEVSWTESIITAGIGYAWQINDNLYIDPFAAVHYRMNDGKVYCGGDEFKRSRISASASVKIGCRINM